MSSSELPGTSRNRAKNGSETDYDYLHSPRGQLNIDTVIQPTEPKSGIYAKSLIMEWQPTTSLSVSPPACKSLPSTHKLDIRKTEDIRNITTFLSNTNLSPDHSYAKPRNPKLLSPGNKENVSLKPAPLSMTKTYTGLNIAGPSRPKTVIQKPIIKAKTKKGSKASAQKPLELPITRRQIAETFSLTEACKFFLTIMKSRRADLKYKESKIEGYSIEIQKATRDAEQVSFKLEAEPETVAEEMSAAITQSQKLQYLLSISSRSFAKLDHLGSSIWKALPEYCNDVEIYHKSLDRLLEYIVITMAEKCR